MHSPNQQRELNDSKLPLFFSAGNKLHNSFHCWSYCSNSRSGEKSRKAGIWPEVVDGCLLDEPNRAFTKDENKLREQKDRKDDEIWTLRTLQYLGMEVINYVAVMNAVVIKCRKPNGSACALASRLPSQHPPTRTPTYQPPLTPTPSRLNSHPTIPTQPQLPHPPNSHPPPLL